MRVLAKLRHGIYVQDSRCHYDRSLTHPTPTFTGARSVDIETIH